MGVGYTHDRGRDRDFDEVVSSGARYALRDHGRERDTELDLSLRLTWDLADYRDPDRAIAVSRERRELVELRDQVLERVNRLYFEWLRVRVRIAAPSAEAERDSGERQTLQIQARELAAQLDGWTGGVFTRLVRNSPPESRSTP